MNEMIAVPSGKLMPFDYALLPPDVADDAQPAIQRIRLFGDTIAENIAGVGSELIAMKQRLGHGSFMPWVEAKFGWTIRTAENYTQVAERYGAKARRVRHILAIGLLAIALLSVPTASYLKAEEFSLQAREAVCQDDVSEDRGEKSSHLRLWATKPATATTFEESANAGGNLSRRRAGSDTKKSAWFAKTVAMDLHLEQVKTAGNVLEKKFNPDLIQPLPVLMHTFSTGPRKDEVVRKYANWNFEASREIFAPETQGAVVSFSFSMCSLKGAPGGWAGMRIYYLNESGQRISYHDIGQSDLDKSTRSTCRSWMSGSFKRQLKAQDFARLTGITIVVYGQDYASRC